MRTKRPEMKSIFYSWMILMALSLQCYCVDAVASSNRPEDLPATFRHIGDYQLHSKIRIERGGVHPVIISPLNYQVYSDGIDLRLYCRVSGEDNYTTYQIYRSDGIGVARKSGEIDLVAGVQALNTSAEMIRQISITRNSFTLVKMPPRSHRVIVSRALAIDTDALAGEETSNKQ